MQPLLFDQGLPGGRKVSSALSALGLEAKTVGGAGAPPEDSADEANIRWCKQHRAVLVTHDRGNKDREILTMLDRFEVGAILVLRNLRQVPPHHLARALLAAEAKMDHLAASGTRIRHHLRPTGNLVKPG
jgi:hypothetical protein